jgi:hypothetical protein
MPSDGIVTDNEMIIRKDNNKVPFCSIQSLMSRR